MDEGSPATQVVAAIEAALGHVITHRDSAMGLLFEATRENRGRHVSVRHVADWNGLDWKQQPPDEWRFFVRWGQHAHPPGSDSTIKHIDGATLLRASTLEEFVRRWLIDFAPQERLPRPDF